MAKISRKVWLGGVWLSLLPLIATAQITEPLHIESGLLTGMPGSDPTVRVYKGIPYAAPPVGALRWHAPQPPPSWEGGREADTFGPGCMQHVAGSRPPWTEEFMHQGSVSEDCLYLNVWTTAKDANEKRDLAAVAIEQLAAERAQTAKTDLYLYYFERGIPWPERPEFGAFHTAEVPYFFNNLEMLDRPWESLDRRLADTMSSYWVHFATHGNPNGAELPEWPACNGQDVLFMCLGERIAPDAMADRAVRDFFEAYLAE